MPSPTSCYRCRQPLAEGANYCVACGFYNEGAMLDKSINVHLQVEKRRQWWEMFGNLANLFRFIRFR